MTTVNGTGLLTVKAAAQMLGISPAFVYVLMARGELAYVQLGRSRRIDPAAVRELIDRNTVRRKEADGA